MSSTPKPWKAYVCQVYPDSAQAIVILLMNEPSELFNYTTNKFIHIDEIGPLVKEVPMPQDIMDKLLVAYY